MYQFKENIILFKKKSIINNISVPIEQVETCNNLLKFKYPGMFLDRLDAVVTFIFDCFAIFRKQIIDCFQRFLC